MALLKVKQQRLQQRQQCTTNTVHSLEQSVERVLHWKEEVMQILDNTPDMSVRDIAEIVEVSKSKVGRFVKQYREH